MEIKDEEIKEIKNKKKTQNKLGIVIMSLCIIIAAVFACIKTNVFGLLKKDKNILMIYMVASNLESEHGFATEDIEEIKNSGFDEENLEIYICTGGTKKWNYDGIPNDKSVIYKADSSGITEEKVFEKDNMADSSHITEFIDYIYKNHKASDYGLIFWNHGGGAVVGYGIDENYKEIIPVEELGTAIGNTEFAKDKNKFEWTGFDACLMGMIETAKVLEPYSDYMIASEELEPGPGWNYSFLKEISEKDNFEGENAGKIIVDGYEKHYKENQEPYSLACLDLSRTENVIKAFDNFIEETGGSIDAEKYIKIAKARNKTREFGRNGTDSIYDAVDMYNLAENMENEFGTESLSLKSALERMIVCTTSNIQNANGIAVYFPYKNKENAVQWIEKYKKFNLSEVYNRFIENFYAAAESGPMAEWNVEKQAPQGENNEYFVELDDSEVLNFSTAYNQLWKKEKDSDIYSLYIESLTDISAGNKLKSWFTGKVFYLVNGQYKVPLCVQEIEKQGDISLYSTRIFTNEMPLTKLNLEFSRNNKNGEIKIIGFYKINNVLDSNEGKLVPEKIKYEYQKPLGYLPSKYRRKIAFNDDGTFKPFYKWMPIPAETLEGITIDSKEEFDNLKVELLNIEDEENKEFINLFYIKDLQQNGHFTDYIKITV